MAPSAMQRYLAELIGTFGLVISITGAALLTLGEPFGGDERVFLLSFALGAGTLGMIYAFGDISGGHFNPAVTIAMFINGRTKLNDLVPYIVCQLVGGIIAVGVVAGISYGYGPSWNASIGAAFASQGYSGGSSPYLFSLGSVFLIEVALTFFLVFVILMATREGGFAKNVAPIGIALTLTMTNLIAIPVDGASVNPARSFAPAILSAYWSSNQWAIQQDWLFWVAPIIGGVIAAFAARAFAHATD
jgi:aquaporin Z